MTDTGTLLEDGGTSGSRSRRADGWLADIRISYDRVADSYSDYTRVALAGEPYLLAALALFADLVHAAGGGPVADVGCGPGHVTAHLHKLGVDAFGVDLITAPLAFWSLIHIPDDEIPAVLGHFRRVLRPDEPLLLGFHVGDESRLKTEGYGGHPMKVYVHRRQPDRMATWLRDVGFTVKAQMLLGLDERFPGAVLFAHRRP
ncbi:class I SAM-dependent methyltransferase [Salinispora arenicola]|uniref:class I SAM-dependent methyltransferase n=1 Tax=Salinispora arenicola TaxID=168697 RepID=UPI00039BD9B3|nr:class I SAM-dependent methyltransferase [Salinispora arenicola]